MTDFHRAFSASLNKAAARARHAAPARPLAIWTNPKNGEVRVYANHRNDGAKVWAVADADGLPVVKGFADHGTPRAYAGHGRGWAIALFIDAAAEAGIDFIGETTFADLIAAL